MLPWSSIAHHAARRVPQSMTEILHVGLLRGASAEALILRGRPDSTTTKRRAAAFMTVVLLVGDLPDFIASGEARDKDDSLGE